jgi:hypothetical protein
VETTVTTSIYVHADVGVTIPPGTSLYKGAQIVPITVASGSLAHAMVVSNGSGKLSAALTVTAGPSFYDNIVLND